MTHMMDSILQELSLVVNAHEHMEENKHMNA